VAAEKSMSACLITTEKDYVRIAHKIAWPMDLYVVGIEIEFGADVERFNSFIKDRLKELRETSKPLK
jgi:tetraacyldisaccharide-1-P 4'-kinase